MFKKTLFLILLFVLTANISAQKPDWDKWDDWDDWNNFEIDFGKNPYLEINYGFGQPKLKLIGNEFSNTGLAELKLGYRSVENFKDDFIITSKDNFSFFQFISPELKSKVTDNSKIQVSAWRFGFGNLSGIGYKTGNLNIIPYNEMYFAWTKLDFTNISDYSIYAVNFRKPLVDLKPLDYYGNSFRFGTTSSTGLKLEIASFISLNGAYETSVVYPRHLFWKNAGSLVTEAIGGGFIDFFVDEVMDSTPAAGPILNILLKGSLSYAFYSLRRDNMNWPFGGVKPLTFEHFKFGLTFTF